MKSIDVERSRAKKVQTHLLANPKKAALKTTKNGLFEPLGITSKDFQTVFGSLTQASVALCKLVESENVPVDFVYLDVNPIYEDFFGKKKQDLLFKKVSELEPDMQFSSPSQWLTMLGKVAKTGVQDQCEVYQNGQDRWLQIYGYSPKKNYFISVFMDITERKKAERESIMSEQWYRRLYETTHDGIMARDVEGKMIDCNKAYAQMLGYSKKELRLLTVQQLLPERWLEQREKIVNSILATGHSIVFEREYKRKDGSIFPASVRTWRLTDGKGKVMGIWSIVRDISEQKAHQKTLEEQAANLEQLVDERTRQLKDTERLAAIGQTAGMVGHDLRNPLQTVTGELYLAKCEIEPLPEGDLKKSLLETIYVIEEQMVYMDKIVSDLQAFVQPVRMDKKPLNLKELIDGVLDSITIPANIVVNTQSRDNFPQIKADTQLLRRVLINLVTNSVQAMPEGGKLTVKYGANEAGNVFVSVEDNGVGIPEKIKPKIFTPLFTTKPRGQGFGLAVCKRVMEAHGGSISFESEEGKGAKFTLEFPTS